MDKLLNIEKRHPVLTCFSTATVNVIAIFMAEFIGSFLLLFVGCAGAISWNGIILPGYINAFNFGLILMIIIQTFGAISGALLNPAMTLSALIYGIITFNMAILYTIAQIIGGVIGFGVLKFITPENIFSTPDGSPGYCTTVPHQDITMTQAILVEFFATMILVAVSCSVWDPRNAKHQDSISIKLGLTLSGLSVAFGGYTGCSMNPVRSFAPAVWNNEWIMHWIYWVVPVLSAAFTTFTYKIIFWKEI